MKCLPVTRFINALIMQIFLICGLALRGREAVGGMNGHHVPDNVNSYEVKKGHRPVPQIYGKAMIHSD